MMMTMSVTATILAEGCPNRYQEKGNGKKEGFHSGRWLCVKRRSDVREKPIV
jgi:hypothetical protein